LIVTPITQPQSTTTLLAGVTAWLPARRYIDLLHPTLVYDGRRRLQIHRSLSDIPVFAKEGTIAVLDSTPILRNGAHRPVAVEVLVVVGADGHFELVEEPEREDSSVQPPLSSFVRTPITWRQSDGRLTIGPEWNGSGKWRQWTVKLVGHTASNVAASAPVFKVTRDIKTRSTVLELGNVHRWAKAGFEIYLGDDLQLDVVDIPARLKDMLMRSEMPHWQKEVIWRIVVEEKDRESIEKRIDKFLALDIDAALKDAVMEIWSADGRSAGAASGFEKWSSVEMADKENRGGSETEDRTKCPVVSEGDAEGDSEVGGDGDSGDEYVLL
jgi:hypothetical protein